MSVFRSAYFTGWASKAMFTLRCCMFAVYTRDSLYVWLFLPAISRMPVSARNITTLAAIVAPTCYIFKVLVGFNSLKYTRDRQRSVKNPAVYRPQARTSVYWGVYYRRDMWCTGLERSTSHNYLSLSAPASMMAESPLHLSEYREHLTLLSPDWCCKKMHPKSMSSWRKESQT